MKKFLSLLIGSLAIFGLLGAVDSFAAAFPPALGGTGTSIIPASGTVLIGNGAGTYTPSTLTAGSNIQITNASGSVTIAVTGTATGTVYVLNGGHGIALTPAQITSSGTIAITTSTLIADVLASGQFLASSTTYVVSVNGQSGAVTLGIPATTTINSAQATVFKIIGDGTSVTSTVNGTTTTFSIINSGNWAGTWQGVNSSTFYLSSNPSSFISSTKVNGFAGTVFQILAGSGITSTIVNGSTTFTLNLGPGCGGANFVQTISPTGTITCSTPTGGSSTVMNGASGVNVSALINGNQTSTLDQSFAASWSALETFLKGATINGTTTLASTTSAIIWTDANGKVTAVTIGSGLSFNTSTGQLSFSNPGFASSSITISSGGILSGGGDLSANRTISLSTSTLYGFFSGSSPITFNASTGAISFTNPGFVTAASSVTWTATQTFNAATNFNNTTTFNSSTIFNVVPVDASGNQFVTSTSGGTGGLASSSASWNNNTLTFISGGSQLQGIPELSYNTSTGQTKVTGQSGKAYGNSISTGGIWNITNTVSTSTDMVINDSTNNRTGRGVVWNFSGTTNSQDGFVLINNASGSTGFNIQCNAAGKGCGKFENNMPLDGSDDSNGSVLSLLTNGTTTKAQSLFMNTASSTGDAIHTIALGGLDTFKVSYLGVPTFAGLGSGGSPCLVVSSAGLVSTSSCGGVAVVNVNGISSGTFNLLAAGPGLSVASSANPNNITYTFTNPGFITAASATSFSASNTFLATATFAGNVLFVPTSTVLATDAIGQLIATTTPGGLGSYNVTSPNSWITVSTTTTSAALTFSPNLQNSSDSAFLGFEAGKKANTGLHNVGIGYRALTSASTSNDNTGVGYFALGLNNADKNVGLGYYAGGNSTSGANEFFVGNVAQANYANDKAYSLLYGNFAGAAATTTNQKLTVNGQLFSLGAFNASGTITQSGVPVGFSNVSTSTANTWSASQTFTGGATFNSTATFNSSTIIANVTSSILATNSTGNIVATTSYVSSFNGATGTITYNVSSTLASSTINLVVNSPTSTAANPNYTIASWDYQRAFTKIECYDAAGTTTINIWNSTGYSTSTKNADIIAGDFACGVGGNSTTTFTSSTLPANFGLVVNVTSTAGSPTQLRIRFMTTKQ